MELKPGYKQTEVGVIPDDWTVRSLGSLAALVASGRSSTGSDTGDFPVHGSTGIIGYTAHPEYEGNALLVARVGANAGRLNFVSGRYGVTDNTIILRMSAACDLGFIWRQLEGKRLNNLVFGSGQPLITGTQLKSLPLGLPALPEQHAIATALGDVNALLDGLDRLIAKKRDLKQAVVQQLLTGQTRLPGFHDEWEVTRLGEVVDTDPENLSSETRPDFAFNYIALEDVDRGFLRSYSEEHFATAPSRARRKLRLDDVLVSTVRPNLQSHLLFRAEGNNWVCSTGFCVVRCRQSVTHPGYIFFHLFGNRVSHQIEALLTGSNYPAINSGDVRALEIPLPNFAEQTAIASVLSDMDAELSSLEARRDKTRDLKQAMMQELLTGRTRLVPAGAAHA